jgi:hypothetical protein
MGNAPTKPMGHAPSAEWAAAGATPDAAQGGIRPCNIYSLCNVVPDTPVHTHRLCSFCEDDGAATAATATPTTPTTPTPARRGGSAKKKQERARRARRERRRKKRAQQKKRLRRKMARRQLLSQAVHAANDAAQSATPLSLPFPLDECEALLRTSDDDSDSDSDDTGSATGSGSESDESERGGAGKRRARRRREGRRGEGEEVPTDDNRNNTNTRGGRAADLGRPSSGRAALPDMLDRRFDLDVAPSLESVDPRYNAAIATAMVLYNHLFLRFGVRYMVSPRDLFEKAIAAFYRSSLGDAHAYAHALTAKIDLSTMLRVLRTDASLRCEFECPSHVGSAAEEYEALRLAAVGDDRRDHLLLGERRTPPPPDARPLYTMEYAYVEGDEDTMKRALLEEHCVVCNLSIFTNIFGAAGATGVCERDKRGPDSGGTSGGGPDLDEPTAVPIVPGAPCVLQPPSQRDQALGMIAIYVVGYQGRHWIARFPFGLHWGERGYGYIPFDYFQRYNRDRWVMRATSCDDPTEHLQRRLQEQVAPTLPSALPHAMALDRALGGADASSHRSRRRPRRRKDTGGRRRREEAEEEEELTASDEDGGRGARSQQRGQGRGIMRRVV